MIRNDFVTIIVTILWTFPVLAADAASRPTEQETGRTAYHRLTEEWACATIRLYSNTQSATADEVNDWGEHWRIAEVQKALQSLSDRSVCMSVPELNAIREQIKKQAIAELHEQEYLRLMWLHTKLAQTDYDPRYPGNSLVPATIKGMQALGWGDKQILRAVTGQNALESRMLTNSLYESVFQEVKAEREPYQDPTLKELVRKWPATLGAAAEAADAVAKVAQHKRSPQSPAASLSPPASP
jgi:hypothetical protein